MSLTQYLRDQSYDLIDGPVRTHKNLQLWLKKPGNGVQLYFSNISHAFTSDVALTEVENPALSVNASHKNDYGFNIGITLVENILKSFGLGNFELSSQIKSGKKVTVSYDGSYTRECPVGEIDNYLATADFRHPNPSLLKNANRNNILVINGTVYARNLVVDIETDFSLDAELVAQLNNIANGDLEFTSSSEKKLKMVSSGNTPFPVAVQANRIDFDKSKFKTLKLVTDKLSINPF